MFGQRHFFDGRTCRCQFHTSIVVEAIFQQAGTLCPPRRIATFKQQGNQFHITFFRRCCQAFSRFVCETSFDTSCISILIFIIGNQIVMAHPVVILCDHFGIIGKLSVCPITRETLFGNNFRQCFVLHKRHGKQCHIISAGIMVFIMIAMSIGEMAVDCTQFFRFFVHQISKYRFAFCKGHILIIFRFSGCCRCQHVGRVIAGRHQQTSQGIFHSQFFIQHMASFTGIQCHFVDFCTNCDDFIRL